MKKILAVILFLGALVLFYYAWLQDRPDPNRVLQEELLKTTQEDSELYFVYLESKSPDAFARITIPGILDLPVVQGEDNVFYLDHDVTGKKDRHGAIFLGAQAEEGDPHQVIYGHNMDDDTAFSPLIRFRERKFLEEHRDLYIEKKGETRVYQAVGFFTIDLDHDRAFLYHHVHDFSEMKREEFFRQVKLRGYTLEEPQEDGIYLTLSTCDNAKRDARICVLYRLLKTEAY